MLRIKYERLHLGWNQTTVAFYAGMAVADVSRIESGRLRPYPSQLERLSGVFRVSGDALLQEVPDTDPHATTTIAATSEAVRA